LGHRRGLSHGFLLDGNECWLGPCHVPLAGGGGDTLFRLKTICNIH
jgi:hypothetical protein